MLFTFLHRIFYSVARVGIALGVSATLMACAPKQADITTLNGRTMGTTWHVKLSNFPDYAPVSADQSRMLSEYIQAELDAVNKAMSTYDKTSEISRFNALKKATCMPISERFLIVVRTALELYKKSEGAFDATIAPLVNLWGFGPSAKTSVSPHNDEITRVKQRVGSQYISIKDNTLCKSRADVTLDLSAIAKGFGVDAVGQVLERTGYANALIEIGGELYARGVKDDNTSWTVAIEKPQVGARSVFKKSALALQNAGIATSGDYRNYFEENGVRYSHTLNARTGYPITHNVASVTVVAENAMRADGWATAMMVLGKDKGLALANRYRLKVFMISRTPNGFVSSQSKAFHP